jgi:hypothetical protein
MRLIIQFILGVFGVLFLVAALWPAGREAIALAGAGHQFIPLGQLWFEIDPPSLNMTQAGIQRHVSPRLWEALLQPLLEMPAWPVLGGTGLVLLLLRPAAR